MLCTEPVAAARWPWWLWRVVDSLGSTFLVCRDSSGGGAHTPDRWGVVLSCVWLPPSTPVPFLDSVDMVIFGGFRDLC